VTEYRFPYYRAVAGGGSEAREIVVEAETEQEALEMAVEKMNEE